MAVIGRRAPWRDRFGRLQERGAEVVARLGAPLSVLYVALAGAAAGALLADRLVRSMWGHAIFTGVHQWRTSAVALTLLWIAIGAVAAVVVLGPPGGDEGATGDDA